MTETLNKLKPYLGKSAVAVTTAARSLSWQILNRIKRFRIARAIWLFVAELAGVVLVAYGISLWSIPAALIVGGLILVAAIEVRPHVGQGYPDLPPPETMLRQQAENAAICINSERYGLGYVDPAALERLTPAECERVIMAARNLGASK